MKTPPAFLNFEHLLPGVVPAFSLPPTAPTPENDHQSSQSGPQTPDAAPKGRRKRTIPDEQATRKRIRVSDPDMSKDSREAGKCRYPDDARSSMTQKSDLADLDRLDMHMTGDLEVLGRRSDSSTQETLSPAVAFPIGSTHTWPLIIPPPRCQSPVKHRMLRAGPVSQAQTDNRPNRPVQQHSLTKSLPQEPLHSQHLNRGTVYPASVRKPSLFVVPGGGGSPHKGTPVDPARRAAWGGKSGTEPAVGGSASGRPEKHENTARGEAHSFIGRGTPVDPVRRAAWGGMIPGLLPPREN
ncbi:hypothetical protein B0H14DRAFT_2803588 [Mycena olivaceomarginata]|nr:hypothetical protein B0H14DRAFT_2803588 [Mycena olivaceomarginata]